MRKLIVTAIVVFTAWAMVAQTTDNKIPTDTVRSLDAIKETKTVSFTLPDWIPTINGTIRANYEFDTENNASRFRVRNARISVSGAISSEFDYKAEIDLCDEGKTKMLDAYVRYMPEEIPFRATIGQMRVPFTLDAHRSPHEQLFVNRSFIAKYGGNVRDVGLAGQYTIKGNVPVTFQAGVFNGSGLTNQKDYWTKAFNFSFKATAQIANVLTLVASCQKSRPEDVGNMMWNGGVSYNDGLWHVEAEYLRKNYLHNAFKGLNIINSFISRKFPLQGKIMSISALGRYDYMGEHSDGKKNEEGMLTATQPERHRMTLGSTLTFGTVRRIELRVNYEKYFYHKDAIIPVSDHDKLVVEVMCRF